MEFCIVYPKWSNYNMITSLFQKNYDKLHLGIIDSLLVEIWVRLLKNDTCDCVNHVMIN